MTPPAALRDAALAALVAFGLFAMLVGLRTDVSPTGGLFLRQRWADVAILCGIVFAGRLAITLWLGRRALRPTTAPGPWTARLQQAGRFFAPALLAAALVLPLLARGDRYVLDLGILVLTYVMLGWGLNIVVGLAGLLAGGLATIWVLYAAAFVLGVAETVYDNAARAMLPRVVRRDQLERGNSLLATAESVTNLFLGAPLGALLFALSAVLPLAACVALYVATAILVVTVRGAFRPERAAPTTLAADIREGLDRAGT